MRVSETYGSYVLLERLGAGGMAEVFFARSSDPALVDRALAVKRMLPELANNSEAVTHFLDEARLGAYLKHRHIVEILDVGELGGSWYMAMSFVDGPDLGKMLNHARTSLDLPAPIAAFIVARAAEGLHFAHTVVEPATNLPVAVVHRDVSPQNILVDRDGVVRIADFGVARSRIQLHHTQPGHTKGKVSYMSPEQLDAQPLDGRSDVRALGVVLWESLALRRMYGGLNDVQVMMRITTMDPPTLASVGVMVDDELEGIVARAVARDRQQRFQTAAELASALDTWNARQPRPVQDGAVAEWVARHFEPQGLVDGVPTQWAFRSMTPTGAPIDDEATLVDTPVQAVTSGPPRPSLASSPSSPSVMPPAPQPTRTPTAVVASAASGEAPPRAPVAAHRFVPVGRPRPLSAGPGQVPTATAADPRELVLYVEDELENRRVAELLLKKHFRLLLAPDDRTACEIIRTRGDELSAVLMDIQLKGSTLDGIALVQLLRGRLPTDRLPEFARDVPQRDLPIFFVTAYAARYGEQELLAVGGDKLVTKPVDFTQLTMALTSFLLRRAASLPRSG